jgi:uncharacterized protein YutD
MKIEAKLMEMETRRAMIVEYLNEYKKYNKEYNTNEMDMYIERYEEVLVKYDIIIAELKSYTIEC